MPANRRESLEPKLDYEKTWIIAKELGIKKPVVEIGD